MRGNLRLSLSKRNDVPQLGTGREKICLRPVLFHFTLNQMVEYRSELLDRTFGALADPTRRRILAQLAKGEECVTDLARPHAMSLAAVSKHLIVLEKAGLVKRRRNGRVHSLALEAKPMQEARAWIDRYRKFWEGNLDQFEKYLDKLQTKKTKQK
jgi:DNA-binding transcriptional ArsR family regulator